MNNLTNLPVDEDVIPANINGDYKNKIVGYLTYNYVDDKIINALNSFVNVKRKNKEKFNLPELLITNTSIEFNDNDDYYDNFKESLQELVSFMKTIGITTIEVDILVVNMNNHDELIHMKEKDGIIVSSLGEIVFRNYC